MFKEICQKKSVYLDIHLKKIVINYLNFHLKFSCVHNGPLITNQVYQLK